MRPNRRFTIYDMMEDKGVFDLNPANPSARSSDGLSVYKKQEFPRMLYHPEGDLKITKPAEAIATPFGPKWVGEEKQLINMTVKDAEEEAVALKAGWHKTPLAANRAGAAKRGEPAPAAMENPYDSARLAQEDEITALKRQIEELSVGKADLEMKLAASTAKPTK